MPHSGQFGHDARKVLEAVQTVPRDERVDVRKRGRHALSYRLEPRITTQRVDPDDAMRQAPQPRQLCCKYFRVAGLETIGKDNDDRAAAACPTGGVAQQLLQRLAEPPAPVPVEDRPPR